MTLYSGRKPDHAHTQKLSRLNAYSKITNDDIPMRRQSLTVTPDGRLGSSTSLPKERRLELVDVLREHNLSSLPATKLLQKVAWRFSWDRLDLVTEFSAHSSNEDVHRSIVIRLSSGIQKQNRCEMKNSSMYDLFAGTVTVGTLNGEVLFYAYADSRSVK